jgi:hypothetical protein
LCSEYRQPDCADDRRAEDKRCQRHYLLDEDTLEFAILMRGKRISLATMCKNESVWIVPGTVSADD